MISLCGGTDAPIFGCCTLSPTNASTDLHQKRHDLIVGGSRLFVHDQIHRPLDPVLEPQPLKSRNRFVHGRCCRRPCLGRLVHHSIQHPCARGGNMRVLGINGRAGSVRVVIQDVKVS
jgi:hypothetical protein